ncbi:hypothetical protein [Paraburkholderia sediminicola]|uniref:hypothetical protein n=1 Tax=Paraburkholderia sediminicola TaxID=458836 RepID=UPI0038BDEBD7
MRAELMFWPPRFALLERLDCLIASHRVRIPRPWFVHVAASTHRPYTHGTLDDPVVRPDFGGRRSFTGISAHLRQVALIKVSLSRRRVEQCNDRVVESFLQASRIAPCLPWIVVFRRRIARLRVPESDRPLLVKTEHHLDVVVRVVIPDLPRNMVPS